MGAPLARGISDVPLHNTEEAVGEEEGEGRRRISPSKDDQGKRGGGKTSMEGGRSGAGAGTDLLAPPPSKAAMEESDLTPAPGVRRKGDLEEVERAGRSARARPGGGAAYSLEETGTVAGTDGSSRSYYVYVQDTSSWGTKFYKDK